MLAGKKEALREIGGVVYVYGYVDERREADRLRLGLRLREAEK